MSGIVMTKAMPTPGKGMRSLFHYMSDGTVVHEHQNDVTAIIEANKFQQGTQDIHHRSEVFNHVARIDMLAIQEWCRKRGIGRGWWREFVTSETLMTEFLNDPDNKLWRTRLGKV
jgi:hypothetical protein